MLADVISGISSASCGQPSPRSQFRSMCTVSPPPSHRIAWCGQPREGRGVDNTNATEVIRELFGPEAVPGVVEFRSVGPVLVVDEQAAGEETVRLVHRQIEYLHALLDDCWLPGLPLVQIAVEQDVIR